MFCLHKVDGSQRADPGKGRLTLQRRQKEAFWRSEATPGTPRGTIEADLAQTTDLRKMKRAVET